MTESYAIESHQHETRQFPPPPDFARQANVTPELAAQLYAEAEADFEAFWAKQAEALDWMTPWTHVLEWNPPHAKWFIGGKLNISANCLDRHLKTWRRTKAAIVWEGEPGDTRTLTYWELHREVCRFANVLKKFGVRAGDRVAIYMPMTPEIAIAMLACARIGATHSVVFGGFSAEALRDRINDAGCKLVVTADGCWRRGTEVRLKPAVDAALEQTPTVETCLVLRRTGSKVDMQPGRDHWWHEMLETVGDDCPPEALDAEHPLFILYTSGTTGKPKGILHTTGGYLTQVAATARWVLDLKDDDVYWCTADVGWVTGHSYVVYGPLANGATVMMYEGAPNHPEPDRFWRIVDRHGVTILYTAPTAIRAFIRWGEQWVLKHRLDSLRLLGTVGEPINPEAWMWYRQVVGKGRCPIVDTWWQTETGGMMIAPLPGATTTTPGTATRPLPGISADIRLKDGRSVDANEGGYLVLTRPWPAMLRTIWGDDERYRRQYWSEIEGVYFAGDGARRDEHGNYWIMGRVDDVINVSGHRLGTAEIESALVSHEAVAEAAVVGRPDELKGSAIVAFVTLQGGRAGDDALRAALREHVAKEIGALAKPDDIRFTDALPKTRSGKIMRRLLREIAASGNVVGDVTTLEDFSVLEKLRADED
ncbi:acetate--CoA ligase [Chloracidobacterium thermophilum]|jgi:acetyl-CoA synthetase|uniref:Acetyl-coenzyme A synthetase n=1 Tax=Chloracidobacterium thermophilum (strain B) TaxID=981222 RepID=G2LKQ3_CHLTF|nr:acetate--CoA ligase [Chloracidobacterium thermophilum]AEP13660.1 acetyl-coenzyme A synthetase [Chloracidobacterium thermophilum B]QUV80113.1 acetate--CoA ligase [Chloracidobacterium thermophilum]